MPWWVVHCSYVLRRCLRILRSSYKTSSGYGRKDDLFTENLSKFQALYNFSARNADELTLKAGDIVMVSTTPDFHRFRDVSFCVLVQVNEKEDVEPGWYSGITNGKKGLFPANYVEKVAAGVDSNQTAGGKMTLSVEMCVCARHNKMDLVTIFV